MTVSLAMIVRNEVTTLPGLLDSVAGCVDEIVIVDTGSSDGTPDLARRYTDTVVTIPWPDDFSAARQEAFDRATGDWVCWLDADDVVRGAEHIRGLTAQAAPDVHGFYWRYVYGRDASGRSTCEFWRERCVRNDGSFRWQGRVHETLWSSGPGRLVRSDAVVVEHHSPPDRAEAKSRRNLALLEREVRDSEGRPSARLLFYLGREHDGLGDIDAALSAFERCAAASTWDEERYVTQLHLSDLHRRAGRFDAAIDADLRSLTICPHWPNAYFSLAETYYFLADWHKVIHWTDLGRAMPEPDTLQIMDPTAYRYRWLIYYTNALYHVGSVDDARAWTARALQQVPDDSQHLANLRFFAAAGAALAGGGR
jgi:glycosyltransferase involved in cell wall biosynthesis